MNKKFLIAAATAATIALAGMSASASAATVDTTATSDTVSVAAATPKLTVTFVGAPTTIYENETLDLNVTVTNTTGRTGIAATATISGTGCASATITPSAYDPINTWTGSGNNRSASLAFSITGLVPGDCIVTVSTNEGGANFDQQGSASTTITVLPVDTTTTAAPETTLAPTTTETASQPANPVTGSSSTALAVMAFGFVLLGWATIAGTRRRHSA